jgi:hypothetical protein
LNLLNCSKVGGELGERVAHIWDRLTLG